MIMYVNSERSGDMSGIYGSMARFYDRLNAGLDYSEWADFAEREIIAHSDKAPTLILDAACGTGSMTIELARRGYDMTGVDLSSEMLTVARERAAAAGQDGILFLCQDIGEIDLYGTVDACVSTLDSINHVTDPDSLYSFFDRLHRCFLERGGVLVFDINTPYKFAHVYGENDFILEDEGMLCAWQNSFDEEEGLCYFYLSLFEEDEDGAYHRTDMTEVERCYSMSEMREMLERAGFEIVGVYSDYDRTPAREDDERWYFVCKNR